MVEHDPLGKKDAKDGAGVAEEGPEEDAELPGRTTSSTQPPLVMLVIDRLGPAGPTVRVELLASQMFRTSNVSPAAVCSPDALKQLASQLMLDPPPALRKSSASPPPSNGRPQTFVAPMVSPALYSQTRGCYPVALRCSL